MLQSFSVKFQLQFADFLINFKSFEQGFESSSPNKVNISLVNQIYNGTFSLNSQKNSVIWVRKNECYYKVNTVIQSGMCKDEIPHLSLIKDVLISADHDIFFCCQSLVNLEFKNRYIGYEIKTENYFYIINDFFLNYKNMSFIFQSLDKNIVPYYV